jgi:hypothetical protein
MLMLLLLQVGNRNEVAEVMKKNNSREIIDAAMLNTEYEAGIKVHQGRELIRYEKPETRDEMLDMNEKPETRAVMVDTTDAVRLDMEYEAGIKVHQGRELIMHEEPETRDGMINKYEKPEMRAVMVDTTDAVMLGWDAQDQPLGQVRQEREHGHHQRRHAQHGVRGWHQGPPRQGDQHVRGARDEGLDARDQPQGQAR